MKLADPDAYYAERAVEHTAQGDICAGIPLVHATWAESAFEAAGARKRPSGPDPAHASVTAFTGLGVVLHYTCGITAQPPDARVLARVQAGGADRLLASASSVDRAAIADLAQLVVAHAPAATDCTYVGCLGDGERIDAFRRARGAAALSPSLR